MEVIEFARENETTSKNKRRHPVLGELAYAKGDTRKQVIVIAKEVIEESVYDPQYSNANNDHGWLDKNGWESRKTFVLAKDGMLYEAYLKIAKTQDGRNILYGVNLDINNGIAVDKGATSKRAAVLAAMPSNKHLPQKGEKVKEQFSLSQEGESYQYGPFATPANNTGGLTQGDGSVCGLACYGIVRRLKITHSNLLLCLSDCVYTHCGRIHGCGNLIRQKPVAKSQFLPPSPKTNYVKSIGGSAKIIQKS